MGHKTLANIIIPVVIILLAYIIFGTFIVGSQGVPDDMVYGYKSDYNPNDTSQKQGFSLIKSNWNRVMSDKTLMQKQVNQSEISN